MQSTNRFYDTGPGPKKGEKGYCSILLPLTLALAFFVLPAAILRALRTQIDARPLDAVSMGFALGVIVLLLAVM